MPSASEQQEVEAPLDIRSRIKAFEGGSGGSSSSLASTSGEAPKRKVRTWNPPGASTDYGAFARTSPSKEAPITSSAEVSAPNAEEPTDDAIPGVRALLARYNSAGQPSGPPAKPKPKPKPAAATGAPAAKSDVMEAAPESQPKVPEEKQAEARQDNNNISPSEATKKAPPAVPTRAKPTIAPALNDPLTRPAAKNAAESSKPNSVPLPPARVRKLASPVDAFSFAVPQAGPSPTFKEDAAPAPLIPARPLARTVESPNVRSESPVSMSRSSSATSVNGPPVMPERPSANLTAPSLPQRPTVSAASQLGSASLAAPPALPRRSGTTAANSPMPASERTLLPPPSRGSTMSVGRSYATAAPTEVNPVRRAGTVRSTLSNEHTSQEDTKRRPSPLDSVDWNFNRPLSGHALVTRRPVPKLSNGVKSSQKARKRDSRGIQSRAPDPEARPRYEELFDHISRGDGSVYKQMAMRVWGKSKLEDELLEALWRDCLLWQANQGLIDDDLDDAGLAQDSLGREAFVRGMAAIDGELLERKLEGG